ncbi:MULTISPECIES: endonuclease/exonuclease/phosphatase family protein [Myxococcus]|uniref:endonuclease/exonuclease/phosphatase family protein n=1 Tax=Myxococcus TaxID=32 RepID=UPI0011429F83|nr:MULTISPECIES: endonuclease/exonuclease/phosphatase family protein [Myxococcus]NOK01757.1 endonuclease/exonuclease/phosphatase family protein [Myxococcus xanthus]
MSRPLPSASRNRKHLRAAALLAALLSLSACEGRGTPPGPNEPCVGAACGPQQPPDTALEGSVRIAAFNLRRLFDTVCDSGECGGSNYEALPTPSEFGLQADRLASAISRLNADVVLLAEVETQASLDALTSRLPRFGYSELGETGAAASVDVAVLSVHPITDVRGHRERTLWRPDGSATRFSRELLEVHLDVDGKKVIVFSAHFRSKSNDDAGRRFAEAVATRDIVASTAQAAPDALIVLGGDLNDVPGSEPITALERDGALLRVSSDRPASETWTYTYHGDLQAIDHLYLARGGGSYVPGSFRTARDPRGGYGGSDHAAVYADFLPAP